MDLQKMLLGFLIIFGSLLTIAGIGALILVKSSNLVLFVFGTGISALAISILSSLYFKNKPALSKKIQLICEIIFAIAIINFLIVFVFSILIGRGDFPHGKIIDGQYYLRSPFGYNEVPYVVYLFSIVYMSTPMITHPLALMAGWIHFTTGGYGRINQLPNLLTSISRKNKWAVYKSERSKSKR